MNQTNSDEVIWQKKIKAEADTLNPKMFDVWPVSESAQIKDGARVCGGRCVCVLGRETAEVEVSPLLMGRS